MSKYIQQTQHTLKNKLAQSVVSSLDLRQIESTRSAKFSREKNIISVHKPVKEEKKLLLRERITWLDLVEEVNRRDKKVMPNSRQKSRAAAQI